MKLMVLILTITFSFSSWSFMNDKDFHKRIKIYEKNQGPVNSGIILKTQQSERTTSQVKQSSGKLEDSYPGGKAGEWKLLRKATAPKE